MFEDGILEDGEHVAVGAVKSGQGIQVLITERACLSVQPHLQYIQSRSRESLGDRDLGLKPSSRSGLSYLDLVSNIGDGAEAGSVRRVEQHAKKEVLSGGDLGAESAVVTAGSVSLIHRYGLLPLGGFQFGRETVGTCSLLRHL